MKGVATGAIGGGIAGGLASSILLGGAGFTDTVVRAAVGNTVGQGIGVVTGLQSTQVEMYKPVMARANVSC